MPTRSAAQAGVIAVFLITIANGEHLVLEPLVPSGANQPRISDALRDLELRSAEIMGGSNQLGNHDKMDLKDSSVHLNEIKNYGSIGGPVLEKEHVVLPPIQLTSPSPLPLRREANTSSSNSSNSSDGSGGINDADLNRYQKESYTINYTTMFLILIPLLSALFCLCVGYCMRQKICFEQLVRLMDRMSPIQPVEPKEEGGEGEEEEEEETDTKGKKKKAADSNKNAVSMARDKQRARGAWTLDVRILQARNLPASDIPILDSFLVGLSDPYATFGLRNKKREAKVPYEPLFQTTVQKSTLHPEWDAAFRTQFSNPDDEISIQVWDWDRLKPHDYLGEALIPVRRLIQKFEERQAAGHKEVMFEDPQWFELYDRRGRVVTGGGRRGQKTGLEVAAVELQFKLDKTYDPLAAVTEMKAAIDMFRDR
mmetsp:Transcript_72120/g.192737  ORF Transcript_72120/g.192737 Transcript_72120/m.192737 type:complete len:425 (-) Transcript_72120:58-1332(-)